MNKKLAKKVLNQTSKNLSKKLKFKVEEGHTFLGYEFKDNYTVVLLQDKEGKKIFTGLSKCNPNCDIYNPEIGLQIAYSRALKSLKENRSLLYL